MVIDFHTHIFPPKVADRAVSHLEQAANVRAYTDGTLDNLRRSMRRSGVDLAVTLPVATNPDSVPSINDYVLSLREEEGIVPFGAIHPLQEGWREEMLRLKEAGIRGIKLHPDYQGVFIDDPAVVRVLSCALELELVVVVHGGVDNAFTDVVHCTPRRVADILPGLPGLKLVVAHYGGNELLEEVRQYLYGSGVYIDTSFTHTAGYAEQCAEIIRTYDPEKVLFATDSPWDDQRGDLNFIRGLNLEPERERRILSENALELLGMAPTT